MSEERVILLKEYIKAGISPILISDMPTTLFEDAVILESHCDSSLLNGHYENADFVAPSWYLEILEKSKIGVPILIIKDINKISVEEQSKFGEILKYKKVSTFNLPNNCIVIVTCTNLEKNVINKDIYSLMAHI